MPKRFEWSLERFYNGFTGSTLQDKEVFASDMSNLQSDDYGNLILRHPFALIHNEGDIIEGLTKSQRGADSIILFLNASNDLKLYPPSGSPLVLTSDGTFSGKLSSAFATKDAIIVTSSGNDKGYWVKTFGAIPPNFNGAIAHPLGIDPPVMTGATKFPDTTGGSMVPGYYFYRHTYSRVPTNLIDIALNEPFPDMESAPSDPEEVLVAGLEDSVQWINLPVNPADTQIKRINQYRSTVQAAPILDPFERESLTYYLTKTMSIQNSSHLDTLDDATLIGNAQLEKTLNKRLPGTLKAVEVYRDLVWGACQDELRYSGIVDGAPKHWQFPEANNIRVNGEIIFVKEYRDMLFFGGPQGVWRLIGSTKYDFEVEQISAVGPLNSWSIEKGEDLLFFVGPSWIYACDGATVHPINEELRPLLKNIIIRDAGIIPMPNGEILFNLYIATVTGTNIPVSIIRKPNGGWEKWQGTNIRQGVVTTDRDEAGAEVEQDVLIIEEGEANIREILWNRSGISVDTDESGNSEIPWVWKSQRIDGETSRVKNMTKAFADIEIDVNVSMAIRLDVWVDDVLVVNADVTVTKKAFSAWRYPIGRRGRMIQFRLTGTKGPVDIRGFKIIGSLL